MKRAILKRLVVCAACLVAPAAWACDAHVRFAWVPQDANAPTSGSVHIIDARSGRTLQAIDGVGNYYGDDGGLAAQDLNNDGCPDLVVTSDVAPIGNTSNTVYLYDRARRRFVFDKALSDIGGLAPDHRDRNCVTGEWKGGAEDIGGARYCWRKGRLVLTREFSVTPLYDRETGEFSCYEHVDTTYAGGRKRVHRDCTKRF